MPMYFNFTNREVTIFLNNSVPIKFMPQEHKELKQEGLEKIYGRYLRVWGEIKESREETKKEPEKGLINEVKQPDPDKELVKEPVQEATKKGRKIIKEAPPVNEGYSPFRIEQTVAGTGRQGKE